MKFQCKVCKKIEKDYLIMTAHILFTHQMSKEATKSLAKGLKGKKK